MILVFEHKFIENKYYREFEEKGILKLYWWECILLQPLRKSIWRVLKELKLELPYDPTTLSTHPKECRSAYHRDTCTLKFISVIFTIARMWN
jgi:hypothetical protein